MALAAFLLFTVASATAWASRAPFDRDAWKADYGQLRREMESSYANLGWLAQHGVDVPALHRQTAARLDSATTNRHARAAIVDFLQAFGDGHLGTADGPPGAVTWAVARWNQFARSGIGATSPAADACDAVGYDDDRDAFGLPFDRAGALRVKSEAPFLSALVNTPDGRGVGIVRIPLFSPQRFRAACIASWPKVAETLGDSSCGDACEHRLQQRAGAWLARRLDETIMQLEISGAVAIVVDITANGGGSEWVEVAARAVTRRPLRSPSTVVLRHAHVRRALQAQREAIARLLANPALTHREVEALQTADERVAEALDSASVPCDMQQVWIRGDGALDCTNAPTGPLFASGTHDLVTPGSIGRPWVEAALFGPAADGARSGRYTGPLLVLVDGRTASASEQFAAMLQDAGAARVIGDHTMGAGCGFTNGGIPHVLRHSGIRIRMPDCARLRADGTNEVAGVTPDVAFAPTMDAEARARRVIAEALRLAK